MVPTHNADGSHGCKAFVFDWNTFTHQVSVSALTFFSPLTNRQPWARAIVQKVLDSQVCDENKVPLIAQESSWDPNPALRPSENQSVVLNISMADLMTMSQERIRENNSRRCLQIHGCHYITPLEFGLPAMRLYRNPFAPCEVQGALLKHVPPPRFLSK